MTHMHPHTVLFLVIASSAAAAGQPLSCGQTNECLSILAEVRFQSRPLTQRQKFEAITDGLNWRVRLLESSPPSEGPALRQEWGSDGTCVYAVTYYDPDY